MDLPELSQCRRPLHACETSVGASETWSPDTDATEPHDSSHLDHISGKHVVLFLCGLVHKPTPIPEAVKLPEAKAAVNKEWVK